MCIFNDFHTVTSHKQKVIYFLEQNAGGDLLLYFRGGGSLFFTDTPLYHKFCYKMLLSIFNNFVLIVRIAINLVFPDIISNVFDKSYNVSFSNKVNQTSLTSTVGERSMNWACLTTISQLCTMIDCHLLKTAYQL